MAASAILGYATVALDANRLSQLGVIGPIIAGFFALVGKMLEIRSASRLRRNEARIRNRQSAVNGFLLGIVLVSVPIAVYFYNHPRGEVSALQAQSPPVPPTSPSTIEPTTPPSVAPTSTTTESPITLEEASAFVGRYIDNASHAETADQAWAMFSEAHANELIAKNRGLDGFKKFWQSVQSVESPDEPSVLSEATSTRAVLVVPLNYTLVPNSNGVQKCTIEHDTFILIRTNGALQIDGYSPSAKDC